MKSYEQLYLLIQSLTPTERRYLKVNSEKGSVDKEAQYMRLFKALEELQNYSADALRDRFEGENTGKYLAVTKAYLLDVVLRSLRGFHGDQLMGLKGRRMVDEVEVLLKKGQLELAVKRVRKGLRWGRQLGNLTVVMDLLALQRRIVKLKGGKGMLADLRKLDQEDGKALDALARQLRIQQIFDVFFVYRTEVAGKREVGDLSDLEELLQEEFLQVSGGELDPESRLNLAGIKAIYHELKGEQGAVLVQHEAKVHLWTEWQEKRNLEPHKYLNDLLNYLDGCISLGETERFEASIDKVRGIKTRNPKEKARRFILHYHLQLRYHLNQGDYAAAARLAPGIEKGLQANKNQITPPTQLTFAYNMMVLHFIQEAKDEALHWADLIAQTAKTKARLDIREITPLFRLLLHYSAGDYQALERESRRVTIQRTGVKWSSILVQGLIQGMEDPSPAHFQELESVLKKEGAFSGIGRLEIAAWFQARIKGGKVGTYL